MRTKDGRGSRKPYKPEPEKLVAYTEEQVREMKRRRVEARRSLEDKRIDIELDPDWSIDT